MMKTHLAIWAILIKITCVTTSTTNFCQYYCGAMKHVCCEYAPCAPGPKCATHYIRYNMTDAERTLLLQIHNNVRNKIASGTDPMLPIGASNMQILTYDKELEFISTCWATQCSMQKYRCMVSTRGQTSQLIWQGQERKAMKSTGRRIIVQTLINYYTSLQQIKRDIISNFTTKNMHEALIAATQVLWANTRYFGCARVSFNAKNRKYKTFHIVCTYFPVGNVEFTPVYEVGKPCTMCPKGTSCNANYTSLCGKIEHSVFDDKFVPPFRLSAPPKHIADLLILFSLVVLFRLF